MEEQILELIKEDIEKEGFEIVDIKTFRQRGKIKISVFIDKTGGVTLADCEKASGIISFLIGGSDLSISDYEIEVSSPGLDRPLKKERDFIRNIGSTLMINLNAPMEDIKGYIEGKLVAVKNGVIELENKNSRKLIPIEKISNAKLKIEI